MRNDFTSGYLAHWGLKKGEKSKKHKYYARENGKNGRYRYFYSLKEYLAYLMNNKEKIASDLLNAGVEKLEGAYDKLTKENELISDDYNYSQKVEDVKKTKEWQDIVRRKDPEYVKYDKQTGKMTYDIGGYIAKKKHPVLDAADDIVSGRKVSVNKVTPKSVTAGAVDYAKTYVGLAAIGTKFLLEKVKFSQGTYAEEKQEAVDYYNTNKQQIVKNAATMSSLMTDENVQKAISDGEKVISQSAAIYASIPTTASVVSKASNGAISEEDYKKLEKEYKQLQKEYEKAQKKKQQEEEKKK